MLFNNKMSINDLVAVFLQTSPLFFTIYVFLGGLIASNYYFILYAVFAFINGIINQILKYVVKYLYNKFNIISLPLIGQGIRPKGAVNCGAIPSQKISKSFGMPSGHSQNAWFLFGFMLLYLINNYKKEKNDTTSQIWFGVKISVLFIIALSVSISRVYVNCHTIQQIIIGSMIGLILGCLGYLLTKYIVEKIEKRK
jgi:membrane-associated phospholipid phosphatase